ncbi:hypothetical protein K2X33_10695 [bacterium]|nr:hypothetical protein [bacterium]
MTKLASLAFAGLLLSATASAVEPMAMESRSAQVSESTETPVVREIARHRRRHRRHHRRHACFRRHRHFHRR